MTYYVLYTDYCSSLNSDTKSYYACNRYQTHDYDIAVFFDAKSAKKFLTINSEQKRLITKHQAAMIAGSEKYINKYNIVQTTPKMFGETKIYIINHRDNGKKDIDKRPIRHINYIYYNHYDRAKIETEYKPQTTEYKALEQDTKEVIEFADKNLANAPHKVLFSGHSKICPELWDIIDSKGNKSATWERY